MPDWEVDARADEAFAFRCDDVASQLAELSVRARRRAARLRQGRDAGSAELERAVDVAGWAHLMSVDAISTSRSAPDDSGT